MQAVAGVIYTRLPDLRRKKEYEERRRLPLRVLSAETGLAVNTIQRFLRGDLERVSVATLDRLCRYFQVGSIAELIEYAPDPDPPADGAPAVADG
jgi:DNA-binding Xre family transcriptional regulator